MFSQSEDDGDEIFVLSWSATRFASANATSTNCTPGTHVDRRPLASHERELFHRPGNIRETIIGQISTHLGERRQSSTHFGTFDYAWKSTVNPESPGKQRDRHCETKAL